VPTTYVNWNNRRAEPLAWLVATAASQSNSPRDLRQQHHAEQEQINVSALGDAGQRLGNGNQAEREEQARAYDRPHGFGKIEGPQDNAGCG
jgi:hypothetical protein